MSMKESNLRYQVGIIVAPLVLLGPLAKNAILATALCGFGLLCVAVWIFVLSKTEPGVYCKAMHVELVGLTILVSCYLFSSQNPFLVIASAIVMAAGLIVAEANVLLRRKEVAMEALLAPLFVLFGLPFF